MLILLINLVLKALKTRSMVQDLCSSNGPGSQSYHEDHNVSKFKLTVPNFTKNLNNSLFLYGNSLTNSFDTH